MREPQVDHNGPCIQPVGKIERMVPAGPEAAAALDEATLDDALAALVGSGALVAGTAVGAGAELDAAELAGAELALDDAGLGAAVGGTGVAVGAGAQATAIKTKRLARAMVKNTLAFISSPLKVF
jgi:hypothetical protein